MGKKIRPLYVELDEKLHAALDDRVAIERRKWPNRHITKAEVVREILTKDLRP